MTKIGNNVKGIDWNTEHEYKELAILNRTVQEEGRVQGHAVPGRGHRRLRFGDAHGAGNQRRVAHKSRTALSKKTGIDHHHLYAGRHEDKITFRDIVAQPRKIITAPTWSGIESEPCPTPPATPTSTSTFPSGRSPAVPTSTRTTSGSSTSAKASCTFKPPVDLKAHHAVPANGEEAAPDAVLDHAALQVGHPLQLPGQPAHADPVPRRPLHLGAEDDAKSVGIEDNDWVGSHQRQRRHHGPRWFPQRSRGMA